MTSRLLWQKISFRLHRSLWRMLKARRPAGGLYSFRLPGGARFDYPFDTAIGQYLFAGAFEVAEVDYVRKVLRAGDIVIDVGANAGLYTVLAAKAVGTTGHVYAFEPGARALELLRHNIAINGLTNVTVIESAVSDATGEASFADAMDPALSSLAANDRVEQRISGWRTVSTVRLDDAVQTYGIPPVRLIKIDVEGAEKLVLDGSPELLRQATPALTILFEAFDENTRPFGYAASDLLRLLQAKGMEVHAFDEARRMRPVEWFGSGIGTEVYNFVAMRR